MLTIEYVAAQRKAVRGISFDTEGLLESYLKLLPFEPTRAQLETMKQLERDMAAEHPMNRLVQGDVGSGKTAVAFFMLYAAVKNGRQGAVMAPTEVLARQHYGTAQSLMGDACGIALLTGSLKKAQKDEVKRGLADGSIDIVIGTHAVIQEGVEFAKLGAVVTDEQHRFGVRQRARLGKKGEAPDVLVLSATPIPRTLSLILYGDLDVSVINELPPGRKPVKTSIVPPHKRGDMYSYIRKTALEGGQAYIVCPLVEQSEQIDAVSAEQLYAELAGGVMSDVSVALLHGRMTGEQKDAVLSRFRKGEISVLVSTTVIEVGVDVANASIMAIEGAERFGLAQLHQLRGRVGRGKNQSYCFLLSQDEQAAKRLKLLCSTNDGFVVAQKDLELRGPGQFLGAEQSGGSDFLYSGLINDVRLLALAKAMAKRIMEDPEYADVKKAELARALRDAGQRLSDITLN